MEKHLICISCPIGCRLTVLENELSEIIVQGNLCHRGKIYGTEEYSNPKRVVTAVVKTNSKTIAYAPVKTDKPLKKELIEKLLESLYRMKITVPIRLGDILIRNFDGTDVNVVFSRTIKE
jgi:CxxC motif-containing protein